MSSHTVNYSASARQFGLIIHSTVSIGYDVPWRQVHQLLVNAARSTPGVMSHPKPFVLETELQDYYPCYQINAYIKEADQLFRRSIRTCIRTYRMCLTKPASRSCRPTIMLSATVVPSLSRLNISKSRILLIKSKKQRII